MSSHIHILNLAPTILEYTFIHASIHGIDQKQSASQIR